MIKNYIHRIFQIVLVACFVLITTGCRETMDGIFSNDIEEGEEVLFATSLSTDVVTRSVEGYSVPQENYQFTIGMYIDDTHKVGEGTYNTIVGDEIGTLAAETPLYWHSTTTAYGFKATAGTTDLETDQTTKEKWLLQDRLEGDADGYKTAKEWKAYNKETKLVSNDEDYKKIPLYMHHQRSLITIILKAGEGVSRKALAFDVAENDLSAQIFSHSTEALAITPLAKEAFVDYEKDKNGDVESQVSTTRYDAIVEPYDYSANPSTDLIAKITLSGQHYSFYASNDFRFNDADNNNRDSYNLEPGKHLIITVTLSRDSRMVMMSAYIEDWTEEVTNTICDDYGNAGEPIKIKTREELIAFLSDDTKNQAGNVALVTNDIDLEDWSQTYDLHCTLSLGGCTLLSNYRFLNKMTDAASLQNGTIQIGGLVDAAIAQENHGSIVAVDVTAKEGAEAQATVAGVVIDNMGSISKCHSALKVNGTTSATYVGGIAATSLSSDNSTAIIDGCTVTNRVSGGSCGGGIVGHANGYVTNNTFEYGITWLQDKDKYKNIIGVKNASHSFTASNNAWPTVDADLDLDNATATEKRYSGIIDSEAELRASTTITNSTMRFRLAQDITVHATTGDVVYELDGNDKQITTEAMIFNAITGKMHDLTIFVSKDLVAQPDENAATDAIAPLAFEVHGEESELSNIKVKMADGTRIQAANPAGVVVWAWGGATIRHCEVKADIQAWVVSTITQGRKFAGGIVSTASKATVTQCVFHSINSTLTGSESSIIYYGGIVGGIEKKDGSSDEPALTITDCTCFAKVADDSHHGGILGNALSGTNTNATKDCQGNWWPLDCNGVGTFIGSVEATIGKRNAITPSEKPF